MRPLALGRYYCNTGKFGEFQNEKRERKKEWAAAGGLRGGVCVRLFHTLRSSMVTGLFRYISFKSFFSPQPPFLRTISD